MEIEIRFPHNPLGDESVQHSWNQLQRIAAEGGTIQQGELFRDLLTVALNLRERVSQLEGAAGN